MMKRSTTWFGIGLLLAAVAILSFLSPELFRRSAPFLVFSAALVAFYRAVGTSRSSDSSEAPVSAAADHSLPSQIQKEAAEASDNVELTVLGPKHVGEQWKETNKIVDGILDLCISIVRANLDVHTVAIFFPTEQGGYRLRRFDSKSDCINEKAEIRPGVGVIGSFLKDGLKQLKLNEIVSDSMTLYYYCKDAGVRSLLASPMIADDLERGTLIVDSTEENRFTDSDHAFLSTLAQFCGKAVYYAYSATEHRLRYARFAAITSSEKYFFEKHEVEAVLDKMEEIIPYAIPCDRLTISIRSPEENTAVIKRAKGPDAGEMANVPFDLKNRTIVSLLYSKNLAFARNFAPDHYEVRYYKDEPQSRDMHSFLAFPIGVDDCKGGLLLESRFPDAFTQAHCSLLSRLVTSAGLAIEKIHILEQARSLATHDGLTGLNNHRQFQKLLRDEVTRANRYSDPLALILCDIDFFKKCNDTHGHPFGDQVLRGVSACLQESIREGVDIAARYGGEEFALIFVKSGSESAFETAERIRQHVSRRVFTTPQGENVNVTMSFGIAVYGEHTKHTDALIQKADKALYRAKQSGRNRVEVF